MSDRGQHRGEFRAVPDAPSHYLPREDAIAAVERMVLEGEGKVGISAVGVRKGRFGVYGLGGIGKTVLAAAVARSEAVKERFPDGVLWLTVGQEPELTTLQANVARALGHDTVFANAGEGHRRLRELLANHAVLLVIDDVWHVDHASKLDVVGERGRLLLTTRNREVLTALGTSEYRLDVLPMAQAPALSGSDDGTVKLWDVDGGEELRTFEGHGHWVMAVALSADGKRRCRARVTAWSSCGMCTAATTCAPSMATVIWYGRWR